MDGFESIDLASLQEDALVFVGAMQQLQRPDLHESLRLQAERDATGAMDRMRRRLHDGQIHLLNLPLGQRRFLEGAWDAIRCAEAGMLRQPFPEWLGQELLGWIESAIGTVAPAADAPEDQSAPESTEVEQPDGWPRSKGWDFREGEAAFNGVAFPITGIRAKLLKALAQPRWKLTRDELSGVGWGDNSPSSNTFDKTISDLEKVLNRRFKLTDAIKVTRDSPSLYQLDESLGGPKTN